MLSGGNKVFARGSGLEKRQTYKKKEEGKKSKLRARREERMAKCGLLSYKKEKRKGESTFDELREGWDTPPLQWRR